MPLLYCAFKTFVTFTHTEKFSELFNTLHDMKCVTGEWNSWFIATTSFNKLHKAMMLVGLAQEVV
jgi:hypothetical protein